MFGDELTIAPHLVAGEKTMICSISPIRKGRLSFANDDEDEQVANVLPAVLRASVETI